MKKILLIFFIVNLNNFAFCSNLKLKFLIEIKLLIIFSLIEQDAKLLKLIIKKKNKIFFIKEHLFCLHGLLY